MEIDLALTILRVSLGLTLAAHGYNKFFKGGKIEGTGRWFAAWACALERSMLTLRHVVK